MNAQDKKLELKSQVLSASSNYWDQSTWIKHRDLDGYFELKYPKSVFKKNYPTVVSPLPSKEKIKAVGLVHSVPAKYCSKSDGKCVATTTDMAIELFTVTRNFNDVFKELQKDHGESLPVITIDGHQGVRFSVGTDNEGSVYTVLPINAAKTLFIKRQYLGEDFDKMYSKTRGFIKLTDQKALFEQILSSFIFRPTI